MAFLIRISILLLLSTAVARGQQKQQVVITAEDSVRNLIEALPEVKEKDHIYDSTPPDSTLPYYHVEAGYQGNTRFQPHFYFYVDLPNNIIYIEDLDKGDRTTIDQWRERRKAKTGQK